MLLLRRATLALAALTLLSGCGLAEARQSAIADAAVTPIDPATGLRPGLVGLPDYPSTGWEPSALVNAAATLRGVGLRASDVASGLTVDLLPDGTSLGIPTLDFCDGTYPSEQLRVKRVQLAAFDAKGNYAGISTEVVIYQDAAAARQALREVAAVRLSCPTDKAITTGDGHRIRFAFHTAPGPDNAPLVGADSRVVIHSTMQVDGQPRTVLLVYQVEGRVLAAMYAGDASGKPFPQATLDDFFYLAGDIANRLRAFVKAA